MTARLRIERLDAGHAPLLFAELGDPALYAFVPDDPPTSIAALIARYEQLVAGAPADRGEAWCNWVMIERADARPIGTLQATIRTDHATIAYLVVKRRWGHGFGREGVAWMLEQLAAEGIVRVEAHIDTRNLASIRLVEALGFQMSGRVAGADNFKGHISDEYVYARDLGLGVGLLR